MSEDFYWLPTKLARLDWDKSTYVSAPVLSYADTKDLAYLGNACATAEVSSGEEAGDLLIRLHNGGLSVAFFLHLTAVKAGTEEEIAPIFWSDNFVFLVQGETRVLTLNGLNRR